MNFLSDFLSDTFIYSFGWTLIYSLWYGAIVSFLTLFLLFILKNQSAKTRYQVSVVSMCVILVISVLTFASLNEFYSNLFNENSPGLITTKMQSEISFGIIWLDILPDQISRNLNYFTTHLPLIFTIWFVFVFFLSLKYLGGFVYSQRLKHNRVKSISGYWKNRITELSNMINLRQKVELLESSLIKVPLVIGFFKPVILVPLGFFSGIPNDQIEAIIIHELAHIKRNDYLVKLLQTIVEIIFFFNPFVWWLSSIVNKEREHSCDDLAISITKDNISFVKALAGLCELEVKNSGIALAFGKSNNQTIKRMERIMKQNENKNNVSKVTIALAIILASVVTLGAVSINSSQNNIDFITGEDSLKTKKAKSDFHVPPPPPPIGTEKQKVIKKDLVKIKKNMEKVEKAYKAESDPEKKAKYKEELIHLKKKAKVLSKELNSKGAKKVIKHKENSKIIKELTLKLKKTKNEEDRKKIKKKIQYYKQMADKNPPPPPAPKS